MAGFEPRSTCLAPFTGYPVRVADVVAGFSQPVFPSKFCCAANPCPLKNQGFPLLISLQDPSTASVLAASTKPLLLLGVQRGGSTLSSVLSSHMEFRRPQRSRASIWRAQELQASPSCPHGSCACSPQTKLIRGLVRMLGGCSVLSWRSPEIKPPQEVCVEKKALRLAPCANVWLFVRLRADK